MINPWVGTLLVFVAGLDLGTTSVGRGRRSGRAGSNAVVVAGWQDGEGSRGRQGLGDSDNGLFGAPDFRISVLLVIFHFLVLWGAKWWFSALCASGVGTGAEPIWRMGEHDSGGWEADY